MGCKGLHCDGCTHGSGGGPAAAGIALLIIIAVALRKAWPEIVRAVEITAWTVTGLAGAAILATGTVVTVRVARRVRARRAAQQVAYHVTPVIPAVRLTQPPAIDRPERPALGQPPQNGAWPLPGWRQDIRPRIGRDSDEHRPR